jgi:putative oxidoreductase
MQDLGLLILRLGAAGSMFFAHGLGKLLSYSENMHSFPDPLGLGSPVSLGLAVFAEAICSLLVILGVATRFACVPLLITMYVAGFAIHSSDPWAKKELAFLYSFVFLALMLTGPGRYKLGKGKLG